MRDGDVAETRVRLEYPSEFGIPEVARRLLNTAPELRRERGYIGADQSEFYSELLTGAPTEFGVAVGFVAADSVVYVYGEQVYIPLAAETAQQPQQHRRVGAARIADKNAGAAFEHIVLFYRAVKFSGDNFSCGLGHFEFLTSAARPRLRARAT